MLANHIRIRMKATGQVLDMLPAAAIAKIEAGIAVPVTEERKETFGDTVRNGVQVAAKFIRLAVR